MAANSCSSPAYMVSTTRPIVRFSLRSARTTSSPEPSGRRTSVTTTSGSTSLARAMPSATEPRLAGDVEPVGLGEGAGEALTDQLVVVDEQDGGHGHPGWHGLLQARVASRRVSRRAP